jgi:hypothetical protein
MRIFTVKWFQKWARKEGVSKSALRDAVGEINGGLYDADLGGQVFKKRVALPGQGKSGSVRTIIAFKIDDKAFFIFGFAKRKRANIKDNELKALKLLANELLNYSDKQLSDALTKKELVEISNEEE